ncbi:TonB-dependent receptor [Chitinophaga defluvii]|uniref:TonB-dependent receptor n=1 Tax=Chitinophaga defluvii TaxID=3163343 RepID=A0ABV2T225_9BACT
MRRILPALLLLLSASAIAQNGSVKGKVTANGAPVPYANIILSNTTLGASSGRQGAFEVKNIPPGNYELVVSAIGFQTSTLKLKITADQQVTVAVAMNETFAALNEVVVTGTRTSRRRLESPVAVNILDSRTFNITQSNTLSDGLCFQPGLRMETDCQTCNYSQLRMNGMGGAYSQILINSRPVFSSLMSLYGLEQIPSNMIDRVEVVKGGGSVLYGSSAIAGTVNIITKEPKKSSFTVSNNTSLVDGKVPDNFINANVTVVNEDQNAGVSFFASHRNRDAYDANGDGYSEMPKLTNNSFGFNAFLKFDPRNKLELNGWSINEERRGGNKIDEQADKADQSEYRLHNILVGGFNYEHRFRNENTSFSIYGSAQNTKRNHYTGMDHVDGWGKTKNHSFQGGIQVNHTLNDFLGGKNTLTTGIEEQYEYTFDEIKAYDYLIDQKVNLAGAFLQSDWEVTPSFTVLSGLRVNKSNRVKEAIVTPRLSMLYKLGTTTQFRASYARGFKAPQALETDMHMAFANGGVSVIRVSPDLIAETSNSFNASADFNKANEKLIYGFTLDGFYTRLNNVFILEETGTDENGNQQLIRKNGGIATVKGVTLEGRLNYSQRFQLETGVTLQKSVYGDPVAWSTELPGSTKYLRTPEVYGFYTLTILPQSRFNAALSGVLTGPMDIPHFAGAPGIDKDLVKRTSAFLETNLKLSYQFTLKSIGQDLQFNAGIQNIFNQYQDDFDTGKNRDSNYIYGPGRPRTFFFGFKFGLM